MKKSQTINSGGILMVTNLVILFFSSLLRIFLRNMYHLCNEKGMKMKRFVV